MDFQDNPQSILTFRVGPVLCCAPSLPVRSIITPPKLTHPPGSDRSQPGIFRHGSHIVKVIDLRQKFGIDPAEQTNPGNLIITIFGEESFAFWVDQILDVFDFPTEGWGSIPPAIPRGIFSRTLLLKKQIHLYAEFINLAKINDLGFLKHYIQQLKQSAQKESTVSTDHSQSVTAENNNSTKSNKISPATVIQNTETQADTNLRTPGKVSPATLARITSVTSSTTKPVVKTPAPSKAVITDKQPLTTVKTAHARTAQQATNATIKAPGVKPSPPVPDQPRVSAQISKPAALSTLDVSAVNPAPHKSKAPVETRIKFAKQAPPSGLNDADENTFSSAGILFLVFIFLIGSGSIVYLLLPSPLTKSVPPEAQVIAGTIETPVYLPDTAEQYTYKTVPDEITPQDKQQEEQPGSQIPPAYRAEISHSEDEITITIHKPALDKSENKIPVEPLTVNKTTTVTATENNQAGDPVSESKDEPQIATQTTDKNQQDQTEIKTVKIEPLKPNDDVKALPEAKNIEEVIHIVVKGDTLWAIAKKYVNDPFLYPELARLSHIKNPHRIYPGNRVRIRFVKD